MSGGSPQEPPCMREFVPMRDEADKRGKAIQSAASRKATPQEACGLFSRYVAANLKMLKFAQANSSKCGIPAQVIAQIKQGYDQGETIRAKVCQAAKMQQQAPAGPSLGDALGASQVPSAGNVKSGRGTFDTLTGSPLGTPK